MGKEKIGFIGLGLMGHGMAKNIVEKGFPLTVVGHRNRAPVDDLVSRGASEAKDVRALAEACDIVVICVTGSPEVEALVAGPDGLAAGRQEADDHRLLDLRPVLDDQAGGAGQGARHHADRCAAVAHAEGCRGRHARRDGRRRRRRTWRGRGRS